LAKRSKAPAAPALPSREELVSFITKAPGKVGKRDLAKAFDIKGGDRIWLKQMLKDLEEEGVVDRRKKPPRRATPAWCWPTSRRATATASSSPSRPSGTRAGPPPRS
jgi:predicted ArsR family transcriptional regulator